LQSALTWGCLLLTAFAAAGCSQQNDTISQALGVEQSGPDALNVLKRPPLILPPDYNLRPPRPGEARLNQSDPGATARRTLLGSEAAGSENAREVLTGQTPPAEQAPAASDVSAGQNALLARTNRVERDLDAPLETRAENRVDGALLRELLSWQPPAAAADADAEDRAEVVLVRHEQTPLAVEP
jgi:hypothetical protein